jgi:hypothetical protein
MSDEVLAMRRVIEALDYFLLCAPMPRGQAWKKVLEARDALGVVRSTPVENPFAIGK